MGRYFGNRPDCAYYLLLGLCAAAVFTAFGGIFTYVGYWPEMAFHYPREPNTSIHNDTLTSDNNTSNQIYSIVGPLCILVGVIITLGIGLLAIKYDCEHEPEDAKVAILRLASEVSLNLSTAGSEGGKYEMIRTLEQRVGNGPVPSASRSLPSHGRREEVI